MNKKGFELAASFLVVIILSLVLFGAGMYIFTKIIKTSYDFKNDLDERTIEQLDQVMDDGSLVVVPRNRLNVERKKAGLFPYGFWNEGDVAATFDVSVTDKNALSAVISGAPITYNAVKVNERVHGLISIQVPKTASKGQYAFDIEIKKGGNTYGSIQRVYVLVV
ncbi:MAG: hypothetical protein KJ583_01485 [Nanoarchaeota archaeon]|nr:hypothetical protein [Nanoarchaeota archaeon]MBU1270316.1 hypothetical protein [Nanoarchaeota archaeon]MBU1603965.1 hypothetical protein [Nanoarchaeota archaeon]MBU2443006.1 hypothetical protein [Nanoarchaeota archaeon]